MIVLSPDAIEDIERLRSFLEQKSRDAAQRAMAAIFAAIEPLIEFPDLGMSTRDADIRQIVIRLHRPLCGNGPEQGSGTVARYAFRNPTTRLKGKLLLQRNRKPAEVEVRDQAELFAA
jgi:hypothetical protein